MNRKSLLFLVVVLALLSVFSGVFAKGRLKDNNAYSDYMGKTQDTVNRYTPDFQELWENYYLVDYRDYGENDYLALAVEFGSQGTVEAVDIWITTGAIDELKDYNISRSAGYELVDVGMKIVGLFLDSYTDNLDSDNIGDKVKNTVADAARGGIIYWDQELKKDKELSNATDVALGFLGISSEQIMDRENKSGNRRVSSLLSGDFIISEKVESDLYIISVIRG